MIGSFGMGEMIIVLVIVLIIFGAGKLPEIGKGLGKGIRNFKEASSETLDLPEEKREKLEDKSSSSVKS
jgi:sec-independent protein translocase protein TatA